MLKSFAALRMTASEAFQRPAGDWGSAKHHGSRNEPTISFRISAGMSMAAAKCRSRSQTAVDGSRPLLWEYDKMSDFIAGGSYGYCSATSAPSDPRALPGDPGNEGVKARARAGIFGPRGGMLTRVGQRQGLSRRFARFADVADVAHHDQHVARDEHGVAQGIVFGLAPRVAHRQGEQFKPPVDFRVVEGLSHPG